MDEISNYENSIIYLPLHIFVNSENYEKLKTHGVVVFMDIKDKLVGKVYEKNVSMSEAEKRVETLNLANRIAVCRQVSDIDVFVNLRKEDKAYKCINKAIKKYYVKLMKRKK